LVATTAETTAALVATTADATTTTETAADLLRGGVRRHCRCSKERERDEEREPAETGFHEDTCGYGFNRLAVWR
jgi:hypothetical protein